MYKLLIGGMLGTVVLFGIRVGVARSEEAQARAAPSAPTDRALYIANGDIQSAWKDLETRQVINNRVMEGGTYSINIRIVMEGDPPRVHRQSCDVWVVQAGSATAVTGGELLGAKKNPNNDDAVGSSITGGIEQSLKPGDILYVPPGVPHGFRDAKGFRAFLIRFNTK
jgi:mannose-6-phosphate isomerase-like protein (cupin superfamily)